MEMGIVIHIMGVEPNGNQNPIPADLQHVGCVCACMRAVFSRRVRWSFFVQSGRQIPPGEIRTAFLACIFHAATLMYSDTHLACSSVPASVSHLSQQSANGYPISRHHSGRSNGGGGEPIGPQPHTGRQPKCSAGWFTKLYQYAGNLFKKSSHFLTPFIQPINKTIPQVHRCKIKICQPFRHWGTMENFMAAFLGSTPITTPLTTGLPHIVGLQPLAPKQNEFLYSDKYVVL